MSTRNYLPPVKRDAKGRILPGQRLNPSGRSPNMVTLPDGTKKTPAELFQMETLDCLTIIKSVMHDPSAKDRDKLMAADMIMNRAWGKAKQNIDINKNNVDEDVVRDIVLKEMDDASLRKLLEAGIVDAEVIEAEVTEEDDGDE